MADRIKYGVGLDLSDNDIKDLLLYGVTNANLDTYLDGKTAKIAYDTTNNVIWYYNGTIKKRLALYDEVPTSIALSSLTDVTISTPGNGNMLVYDTSDNKWKNRAISGDVGINASGASTISSNAVTTGKIADGNVTLAKIQNIADQTILGNNAGSAGPPIALTAAQARTVIGAAASSHTHAYTDLTYSGLTTGHVLRATGATAASFGTLASTSFADNTIAPGRLTNCSQYQIISRTGSGSGAAEWTSFSDNIHGTRAGGTLHSAATTSVAGFMSSTDKTKLDGIASGANNYVHPNHSGDVTSVGDGATTVAALQGRTLTMSGSASYTIRITLTANTDVTLPTSGTLATLGNTETFSGNKTFSGTVTLNGNISGSKVITSATGLSSGSTDTSVPTAKCVYEHVNQAIALGVAWRLSADALFNNPAAALAANSNTIDGVTTIVGLIVLVKNSSTSGQINRAFSASGSTDSWTWNPVYFGGSGGVLDPEDGYLAWIKSGTLYSDTKWAFTGTTWIQMGGTGTYTAGTFISIANNVIDVAYLAAGTIIARKEITGSGACSSVSTTSNNRVLKTRNDEITWATIEGNDITDYTIPFAKIAKTTANRIVTTGGDDGALAHLAAGTAHQFLRSAGASLATWSTYTMPSTVGSGDVNKVLAASATNVVSLVDVATILPENISSFKKVLLSSAGNSYTITYSQHPFAEVYNIVLWRLDTNDYRPYHVDFCIERVDVSGSWRYNIKVNSNTNWPANSYLVIFGKKYTGTDPNP